MLGRMRKNSPRVKAILDSCSDIIRVIQQKESERFRGHVEESLHRVSASGQGHTTRTRGDNKAYSRVPPQPPAHANPLPHHHHPRHWLPQHDAVAVQKQRRRRCREFFKQPPAPATAPAPAPAPAQAQAQSPAPEIAPAPEPATSTVGASGRRPAEKGDRPKEANQSRITKRRLTKGG